MAEPMDAANTISHLRETLVERVIVAQFAHENETQQIVPAFVTDSTFAGAVSSIGSYCKSTITSKVTERCLLLIKLYSRVILLDSNVTTIS